MLAGVAHPHSFALPVCSVLRGALSVPASCPGKRLSSDRICSSIGYHTCMRLPMLPPECRTESHIRPLISYKTHTAAAGPDLRSLWQLVPVFRRAILYLLSTTITKVSMSRYTDPTYVLHPMKSLFMYSLTVSQVSGAAKPRSPRATVACTNCHSAGKKCSDARPCARCCQRNMDQSCCDEIPRVRGRKRMRKEQEEVTVMPEASSQLPAEPDYLNLSTWTSGIAQVTTREHEQHTQALLETFGSVWQPQYPSASSSHTTPTWDPAASQNAFPGYYDAPAAGMSEYCGAQVMSNLNEVEAYPTVSQQSFAKPSLDILG
ncbi:hypothetical protein C8Q74DRAFT_1221196 [Fomes fomentarius]|nr:hypothetical protein C8Q74DRAFT_1221196 [Fomes fomentarius]